MTLKDLLEIMVCTAPECGRPIVAKVGDKNALQCTGCGRIYPIEDGIPVLLVEKATRVGTSGNREIGKSENRS